MATSPSSTSSSDRFLRHALIAAALLLAVEAYLRLTLAPLEARNRGLAAEVARPSPAAPNHLALGAEDPERFFARLRAELEAPPVVFVGDSQGAAVKEKGALAYSQVVASRLTAGGAGPVPVLNLHLGGANTFEQGTLLLALLQAGVRPRMVFWAHSVFSLRKNEIRAELAAAWRSLRWEGIGAPPDVIVPAAPAAESARADPVLRFKRAAAAGWGGLLNHSATIRFAGRSLFDKWQLLLRSPLARRLPSKVRPGTARTEDPPASVMLAAADFAGRVSAALGRSGVRVVNFLSPINSQVNPRPFSARAEQAAYPALRRAVESGGAAFADYLNLLPGEDFGRYGDGTPDAFHLDQAGHACLGDSLLARLPGVAR